MDAQIRELERQAGVGDLEALLALRAGLARSGRSPATAAELLPTSGYDWRPLAERWVGLVLDRRHLISSGEGAELYATQAVLTLPVNSHFATRYWLVLVEGTVEPYAVLGQQTGLIYGAVCRSEREPTARFVQGHLLDSQDGLGLVTPRGLGVREVVTTENQAGLQAAIEPNGARANRNPAHYTQGTRLSLGVKLAKFPSLSQVKEWEPLARRFGGKVVASQLNELGKRGERRQKLLGALDATWREYHRAPYYLWIEEPLP